MLRLIFPAVEGEVSVSISIPKARVAADARCRNALIKPITPIGPEGPISQVEKQVALTALSPQTGHFQACSFLLVNATIILVCQAEKFIKCT